MNNDISNETIQAQIETMRRAGTWGSLTIRFRDGKVVLITKEETLTDVGSADVNEDRNPRP